MFGLILELQEFFLNMKKFAVQHTADNFSVL